MVWACNVARCFSSEVKCIFDHKRDFGGLLCNLSWFLFLLNLLLLLLNWLFLLLSFFLLPAESRFLLFLLLLLWLVWLGWLLCGWLLCWSLLLGGFFWCRSDHFLGRRFLLFLASAEPGFLLLLLFLRGWGWCRLILLWLFRCVLFRRCLLRRLLLDCSFSLFDFFLFLFLLLRFTPSGLFLFLGRVFLLSRLSFLRFGLLCFSHGFCLHFLSDFLSWSILLLSLWSRCFNCLFDLLFLLLLAPSWFLLLWRWWWWRFLPCCLLFWSFFSSSLFLLFHRLINDRFIYLLFWCLLLFRLQSNCRVGLVRFTLLFFSFLRFFHLFRSWCLDYSWFGFLFGGRVVLSIGDCRCCCSCCRCLSLSLFLLGLLILFLFLFLRFPPSWFLLFLSRRSFRLWLRNFWLLWSCLCIYWWLCIDWRWCLCLLHHRFFFLCRNFLKWSQSSLLLGFFLLIILLLWLSPSRLLLLLSWWDASWCRLALFGLHRL